MRYSPIRTAAFTGLLVSVIFPAGAPAAIACPTAASQPTASSWQGDRAAVLCLINRERSAAKLPTLRENRQLDHSANAYAQRMVAERFFSHIDPRGGTFDQRFAASGYTAGADLWSGGENLAWGGGNSGSPEAIVRSWMASSGHRENVLYRDYRDIGIAVVVGTPVGGPGGTYSTVFGQRSMPSIPRKATARRASTRRCTFKRTAGGAKHRICVTLRRR